MDLSTYQNSIAIQNSSKLSKTIDESTKEYIENYVEIYIKKRSRRKRTIGIGVCVAIICVIPFIAIYFHDVLIEIGINSNSRANGTYLEIVAPAFITALCGVLAFLGFQKLLHFDEEKEKFKAQMEQKFNEYRQETKNDIKDLAKVLEGEIEKKMKDFSKTLPNH